MSKVTDLQKRLDFVLGEATLEITGCSNGQWRKITDIRNGAHTTVYHANSWGDLVSYVNGMIQTVLLQGDK